MVRTIEIMESKIIRVFPRKTSFTPVDDYAFVGSPPMIRPRALEVHISVTFTWDIDLAYYLQKAWRQYYKHVFIGGPAFNDPGSGFAPGVYIKNGVTFTSRGCNNQCSWCHVPKREGRIRVLNIVPGNIIQDNNLLQCNSVHIADVFRMLKKQKGVVFSGGLQPDLITDAIAFDLKSMSLRHIFLAADTRAAVRPLERAVKKLSGIPQDKIRCYIMVGYQGETINQARERLEAAFEVGTMPFIQLFQPEGEKIKYSREWQDLAREWSRPAIIKALMLNKGAGFPDNVREGNVSQVGGELSADRAPTRMPCMQRRASSTESTNKRRKGQLQ